MITPLNWFDALGAIGTTLIIGTYVFLQLERIKSGSFAYSALNAAGAALILVSLYFHFNFAAFVVELFWLLISLFGVARHFLRKSDV